MTTEERMTTEEDEEFCESYRNGATPKDHIKLINFKSEESDNSSDVPLHSLRKKTPSKFDSANKFDTEKKFDSAIKSEEKSIEKWVGIGALVDEDEEAIDQRLSTSKRQVQLEVEQLKRDLKIKLSPYQEEQSQNEEDN